MLAAAKRGRKLPDTQPSKTNDRAPLPPFLKKIIFGSLGVCALVIAISSYQKAHPSAEDAATAKAELAQQSTAYYQRFQELADHCDNAGSVATALTKTSDTVTRYQALEAAQTACQESERATSSLKKPERANGDLKAAFENASTKCLMTFSLRSEAYGEMAKVMNGDTSPATQAGARSKIDEGNGYATECSNAVDKAVTDGGGELKS